VAEGKFKKVQGELKQAQQDLEKVGAWMEDRRHWAIAIREMRDALIRAENATKQKLGTDTGVWIENLSTMTVGTVDPNNPLGPGPGMPPMNSGLPPELMNRYGGPEGRYGPEGAGRYGPPPVPAESGAEAPPPPPPTPDGQPPIPGPPGAPGVPGVPGGPTGGSTNETATLVCRAVNLKHIAADAETTIAYAVERELKASPYFEPTGTSLSGQQFTSDEASGTFTFTMTLAFKRPHKP
jgi:hypothetical protein